jgi:hypothetical protein
VSTIQQEWLRNSVRKALANCDRTGPIGIIDYGLMGYGAVLATSQQYKNNLDKVVLKINTLEELQENCLPWIMLSESEQEALVQQVLDNLLTSQMYTSDKVDLVLEVVK